MRSNFAAPQEAVPVQQLQPKVPPGLETICLKCLHKDPRGRYASALTLAEDRGRFPDGKPIVARPVGPAERMWRWGKRSPLAASLVAALILVVLVAFGAVTSS